jgi:prefoldin subunit 5
MQTMSKKPQSKDEALEALDFIVNVLKEHEKDLDRLINELGTVTEALGETGELSTKVEKVEERISGLQNEINSLVSYLSASPQQAPVLTPEQKTEVVQTSVMHGPPVILRCKQWDDFQTLAFQAQTLSFMYKEAEKTFQADALKGNQIITYSGELPKLTALLKMWLSKQLEVPEKKILEGVLAIG